MTWAFDSLGRVTSEQNLLGTFAYTYHGTTARLNTVTYPNSQTSTYSYFTSVADLACKIRRYIHRYNKAPKPIRWAYRTPAHRISSTSASTVH